jgi:ribosomal protein S18 acetylase RimI-like enzyme
MAVVISRITLADVAAYREVRLRALLTDPLAFGSTYAREAAWTTAFWRERLERHASGPDRATFLARDADVIAGIIATMRDEHDAASFSLYAVWVAPESRGRGVGASLLARAESFMVENGAHVARLFVSDRAPDARALYEKAGYAEDGRREASPHEGVTEIGMTKTLTLPHGVRGGA